MNPRTSIDTQAMATFIQSFREITDKKRVAEVVRMASFFCDFRALKEASASIEKFNLLDITAVGSDEVKHSSILAWLLTPCASHACGMRFLCSFLKAASLPITEKDIKKCYVRTEVSGNESIIDIFIYQPRSFLVYLENKIFAPEGVDQIDREYRDMLRFGKSLSVPQDKMFPVFLTPNGRPPVSGDSERWRPVSYRALAQEFMAVLPELLDNKIAFLVEDLIEYYKRWSVL